MPRLTIDELLERVQRRLDRVTVDDVLDAVRDGALLVDIRSELQRAMGAWAAAGLPVLRAVAGRGHDGLGRSASALG